MLVGLIMTRCEPTPICEITEEGILAPAGFWGRLRLMPWKELTRCEMIHDDENAHDHFVLWDREGRCRLKASSWFGSVSSADRTRILRVLRSRFPEKAKGDGNAEPALLQAASSAVWDRELDR